MQPLPSPRSILLRTGLPLALLTACGGGGGGAPAAPQPVGPTVAESLAGLGVDIAETQRLGDDGQPLPDSYTPMGATWDLMHDDEVLFVGGLGFTPLSEGDSATLPNGAYPWLRDERPVDSLPQTSRAVAAADLDGDGLEEAAFVFMDGTQLRLEVLHPAQSHPDHQSQLALEPGITHVSVVAGDFDGDGRDELAVGYCRDSDANLMLIEDEDGGFLPIPNSVRSYPATLFGSAMFLALGVGNIDDDREEELVVVINERSLGDGRARYAVLDDWNARLAELHFGPVDGDDSDEPGTRRGCEVADVTLADIDGDNRDEIVFAGLADIRPAGTTTHQLVLIAKDDAVQPGAGAPLADLAVDQIQVTTPPNRRDWVFLDALDYDGDGSIEFLVDDRVYAIQPRAAGANPWRHELVVGGRMGVIGRSGGPFSFTMRAQCAADVDGDGSDEVLVWFDEDLARIFDFDPAQGVMVDRFTTAPPALNAPSAPFAMNPVILPIDVNRDGMTLKYQRERRTVFTQPLLIAAMAAPPCNSAAPQVHDVCQTTFGNTTSGSSASERTITLSASVTVGFEVEVDVLGQTLFEAEFTTTATAAAASIRSAAYEVSRSVEFTTGANEDTVLFSTVPYDQYIYTLVSHPDADREPDLIGRRVVVSIPRRPMTIQVERSFYNRNVGPDMQIDASVFRHVIGEPDSYATRVERDQLLAQFGGLTAGAARDVGQGTGSTTQTLAIGREIGSGQSLEMGWESSVQVTAGGVISGFSVGQSEENTLTVTSGTQTSYTGTVGNIDIDDPGQFLALSYAWGLFTYVQRDHASGQAFQVIDYWVE